MQKEYEEMDRDELISLVTTMNQDIEDLHEEIDNLEERVSELECEIEDKDAEIDDLTEGMSVYGMEDMIGKLLERRNVNVYLGDVIAIKEVLEKVLQERGL